MRVRKKRQHQKQDYDAKRYATEVEGSYSVPEMDGRSGRREEKEEEEGEEEKDGYPIARRQTTAGELEGDPVR